MRQRPVNVLRALFVGALVASAAAQATWEVETLIPELISIRVPTSTIVFGLDGTAYPPDAFPARYPATVPEGGVLPVQVFSNAESTWSLVLEIPDLLDPAGVAIVPAERILFRVNEGLWLRGSGGPQIVFTGVGPTFDWLELRIEFALELTGTELAGAYRVAALVSAVLDAGP